MTGSTACASDDGGWVDAYRALHAEGQDYTWWSNRGAARANNVGWRIDYQIVTPSLRDKLKACSIYTAHAVLGPCAVHRGLRAVSQAAAETRASRAGGGSINLRQPKVLMMLLLGFGSRPADLSGGQHAGLRLREIGIDLGSIGFLSWVGSATR